MREEEFRLHPPRQRRPSPTVWSTPLGEAIGRSLDQAHWRDYMGAAEGRQAFADRIALANEVIRLRDLMDQQAAELQVQIERLQGLTPRKDTLYAEQYVRRPGTTCLMCGAPVGRSCTPDCTALGAGR